MATEIRRIVVAVFAALLAIGVALPVAAATGPQERSPWPQFQHDPQRTGRTTVNGPVTLRQKWVYWTGKRIIGGLAIGEDGTIYAPSHDRLMAVRPDGTRLWRVDVREFLVGGSTADGGDITAPAIDKFDNIIVGVADGRILAIEADEGDLEWAFSIASSPYAHGSSPVRGPALLDSGYCCTMLGADDGEVYQVSSGGSDARCPKGPRCCDGRTCTKPERHGLLGFARAGSFSMAQLGAGDRWRVFDLDDAGCMPVLPSVLTARPTSVLAMGPCTLLTPRVRSDGRRS